MYYIFFCRVFRRFLEIQDISNKNDEMTYEELKTIIASYSDLCKCPELKVTFFSKTLFPVRAELVRTGVTLLT